MDGGGKEEEGMTFSSQSLQARGYYPAGRSLEASIEVHRSDRYQT